MEPDPRARQLCELLDVLPSGMPVCLQYRYPRLERLGEFRKHPIADVVSVFIRDEVRT